MTEARPALLALALVAAVAGCKGASSSGPSLLGRQAPPLSLPTLDHRRFHLNDLRGMAVTLLFWNTTCKACKRQMQELSAMGGQPRMVVVNVCTDPENLDAVRRTVQGLEPRQATLLDRGGQVARAYGVAAYPTTILVAPSGAVALVQEGRHADLPRRLQRALDSHR
jgi:peroxiredoxin